MEKTPDTGQKSITINSLPPKDRPRERMQSLGADVLSTQEILALILGRGISGESVMITAQRLLDRFKDINGIAEASLEELAGVRGIGLAKACQIKAAVELSRRLDGRAGEDGKKPLKTPEDIYAAVQGIFQGKKKELFLAVLLNTRNQVIRVAEISVGSLDSSIVHPREVFKEAISACAACVVFAHNHPSGDVQPSDEDIVLTKRLCQAGEIVGIDVLDHIIVGGKSFCSLKRQGLF